MGRTRLLLREVGIVLLWGRPVYFFCTVIAGDLVLRIRGNGALHGWLAGCMGCRGPVVLLHHFPISWLEKPLSHASELNLSSLEIVISDTRYITGPVISQE